MKKITIIKKIAAILSLILATPFTIIGIIVWFIKECFESGLGYGEDFADWLFK